MPVALAVAQDQSAAVGLDRVAGSQVDDPVGAHDLPVGAAGQDAAFEPRPFDRAAEKVDDAAFAVGRGAELLDARELGADSQDRRFGNEPHWFDPAGEEP